jgi:hypothetical protein
MEECPHCHEMAEGRWEDHGIGTYEYWGAKGVDTDIQWVCEHCGWQLPDPPEPDFNEPDEPEWDYDPR